MSVLNSTSKTKLVHGVGVNDASYSTCPRVSGKKIICPFYRCWQSMLVRCYSKKFQFSCPTYIDCKVCDEWKYFMAFKSWMETQEWEEKELDKDLIGDGKLYSPENCVFVSHALNSLFLDRGAMRGEYPLGVSWKKSNRMFEAKIRAGGKTKYLGLFTCPDEAHEAWCKAKLEITKGFLDNESNPRIRYAIECGIAKLTNNERGF